MPSHSPKHRSREREARRLESLLQSRGPGPALLLLQRAGGEGSGTGTGTGQPPPSPRHREAAPGLRRDSASEDGRMKLNPSLLGIALRSLLAVDLWLSKRLGVCATDDSPWGSARPIMKLIEVSGHGIPWLAGTVYCLVKSDSPAGQEVLLNLLLALILDLVLVGVVKSLVRRRRPTHNRMDMFATFSVDRYSFPSGHATRAAMGGRFFLNHLVLAVPLRILVVLWVCIVGLSRVMLGRHNVTDVLCGFIMGYLQFSLVEYMWLSSNNLQTFLRLCGLK
ncbi:polyisoprenoid diphosphate/phosphate phosphohydrolase PLPP6 [Leucoraja erinacea]|uniref:polyisoprenoid diphosphate/phosphate phosphohydrolase PLPP6 n=1 Tax=Leucoraja erinaceus TaxID=7782 RepID=UPI002458A09C|nr:polyisoprenoid diphosphate/phosphate phosphohydrolase PLPP6 [Leucoraja erinacea]